MTPIHDCPNCRCLQARGEQGEIDQSAPFFPLVMLLDGMTHRVQVEQMLASRQARKDAS